MYEDQSKEGQCKKIRARKISVRKISVRRSVLGDQCKKISARKVSVRRSVQGRSVFGRSVPHFPLSGRECSNQLQLVRFWLQKRNTDKNYVPSCICDGLAGLSWSL